MKRSFTTFRITLFAFTVLCSLFSVLSFAQLPSPLNAPLIISGAFGEPRDNHFHTGIDFTTRKKTGIEVFAVKDGYVSRIKVSSVGYGRALYISHADGTMTVYGHLEKFNDTIQQYVTSEQYKAEKFEVELYPDKNKFKVRQGEVVAYSGNSGGSSAPHLHFEIRDASGESFPLNPLANGLNIKDTIPPLLRSIVLYDRKGIVETTVKEIALIRTGNRYSMSGTDKLDTLKVNTSLPAFGIRAEDYANGVDPDGDFGIYSLLLQIDGKDFFSFTMDRLDFEEGRYANGLVDYRKRKTEKKRIYRAHLLPGNNASIYQTKKQAIELNDGLVHEVLVTAKDFHGNAAVYKFYLKNISEKTSSPVNAPKNFVQHDQPYSINADNIKIHFDANSFYDNIFFTWSKAEKRVGSYITSAYDVGDTSIPIHKNFTLSIKPEIEIAEPLKKKCVIMRGTHAYTTEWHNDWLIARPREFGNFRAVIDTLPPKLSPVNFKNGGAAPASALKLTITDLMSGVKDYDIYIDGNWTLAEFDAKNDLLTVIPKQKPSAGGHEIKAVVTDKVGNKKTYTYKLSY